MPLTEAQKQAYLEDSGTCPYCHSEEIEGGFVQIDGRSAWQAVSCNKCNAVWNDIYTLTEVEEVYPPETQEDLSNG